jgi:hypothetical protein
MQALYLAFLVHLTTLAAGSFPAGTQGSAAPSALSVTEGNQLIGARARLAEFRRICDASRPLEGGARWLKRSCGTLEVAAVKQATRACDPAR